MGSGVTQIDLEGEDQFRETDRLSTHVRMGAFQLVEGETEVGLK